jgi:hypothetical protein
MQPLMRLKIQVKILTVLRVWNNAKIGGKNEIIKICNAHFYFDITADIV